MPMDFARSTGRGALYAADGRNRRGVRARPGLPRINLVLVARREDVLEAFAKEVRGRYDVEVLTVPLDLARQDAMARLSAETAELEIGSLIANAGGNDYSAAFLEKDLDAHLALVKRNCVGVLEAAYRFGGPMIARRGGSSW